MKFICVGSVRFVNEVLNDVPEWHAGLTPQDRENYISHWHKKWGWDPFLPDLHNIRRRWNATRICWRVGESLLDTWPSPRPPVDLVMSTFNAVDKLAGCLNSLRYTAYPECKLWLIDNGSTDGTKNFLAEMDWGKFPLPVSVTHLPVNVGVPSALNWAIRQSSAPLVARLDDDLCLPPDWLAKFVDVLREHPYAAVVGGKIVNLGRPEQLQCADLRFWPKFSNHRGELDRGQFDFLARCSHVQGCCMLYRRKAFEKSGMFDNRYSPTQYDDPDHHISVIAAGYDVLYDGRVTIQHALVAGADRSLIARTNSQGNAHKMTGKWGRNVFEIIESNLDRSGRFNA